MPYLYTLYRMAHERGEPILRPLSYEFEDDPRAWADSDDFMFGPLLLVANVVEPGARERRLYLPACDSGWYDFHSGQHWAGGTEVVVPAPLGHIPLFARGGAIIPLTGGKDFAMLHDEPSRQLRVFPQAREAVTRFSLYEDDGTSMRYRDAQFTEVDLAMRTTGDEILVSATTTGSYALPYPRIDVALPPAERRKLTLTGNGVELARAADVSSTGDEL
jgi:alpha-glucosidase